MTLFDKEILKGNFFVSECHKCKKLVWPPSEYCNKCFSKVKWKKFDKIGTIVEYSKKGNNYFGIVEFDKNIRIMGTLIVNDKIPQIGNSVRLENCNAENGYYKFTMKVI